MLRLAVDTAAWQPTIQEFEELLAFLPKQEQQDALRYCQQEDKKRALARYSYSRLKLSLSVI